MLIRIVGILLLCSLAACAVNNGSPARGTDAGDSKVSVYFVQRGDTLYSIAFRYGLDYRKVAEVNRIYDPYTIYPGQSIYLWETLPAATAGTGASAGAAAGTPAPVSAAPAVPAIPTPATPSPVIVTAVPGIGAPVSQVAMPGRGAAPAAAGGYQASAPAQQTAPASAAAPPVYAGTVSNPGQTPVPAIAATTDESVTAAAPSPATAGAPVSPGIDPSASPIASAAASPTPAPPVAAAPPPPARAPTPGGKVSAWRWPATGTVTRGYSSSVHKGIDIDGNRGDPVFAVADGTVVYAGTGIVGFGELIIIKHNDIYISAYGHNDRLLVRENDIVGAGQTIAEKGSSGTDTVKLHFEIRQEGKPIDPLKLLPRP